MAWAKSSTARANSNAPAPKAIKPALTLAGGKHRTPMSEPMFREIALMSPYKKASQIKWSEMRSPTFVDIPKRLGRDVRQLRRHPPFVLT
mmetsp:Transcript_5496/g.15780  ORF Transcript_5496/g.15780 Transcript_5496/m.15780 type:complete len:90 (+) Transcript_5496:444-713(+)